jgi:hypothetical protein
MLMPLLPSLLRRCSNTSRGAAPAAHHCLLQRQKKSVEARKLFNPADYSAYFLDRLLDRLLGRGVDRRAGLLLQFFQFFLQERQARDQRAICLIRGRLLLHLSPSRIGILFVPRRLVSTLNAPCEARLSSERR